MAEPDATTETATAQAAATQTAATEAAAPGAPESAAAPEDDALRSAVVDVLRTVYDPEIPVNIYEMGLVYDIEIDAARAVRVRMTLTSPMCPVAESLPPEVEAKVRGIPGVSDAAVDVVWDPPWNPGMMSEAARLELGM